ncbi:MAG: EF-P beta-lysylation protein EpmB [Natronospirillum sp.]|uniref:EF-P beta-lysylation protein EpmB n=1 Tax=Natronospirillum sp. TaxID=2812955 RepID=UPI0025DB1EB7|nr:EF-P beta-lysylation protein EpmB [Natronospirillum sp.]MCH8550693.1 EF-P beta-lysylation protein EpmB [Natronospirillum sp.]
MITGNHQPLQFRPVDTPEKDAWQAQLTDMITTLPELLAHLQLSNPPAELADMAQNGFPVRVTRHFASLMQPGDWADPLLHQVLPWAREAEPTAGYVTDPLAEEVATVMPGLIHKYRSRVLIVPTSACAIHCRYCFRRHFPYSEHRLSATERQHILEYLRSDSSINEVIFSGGDPLMLPDKVLAGWLDALADIPHLRRVRLHSRLPVVLPDRLTRTLLDTLTGSRLQPILVLHANHARELDTRLAKRMEPWRMSPVTLLNQAVLLRGVNADSAVLAALSERLFAIGVLPYYLHQTDAVAGTAHFTVGDGEAKALYREIQGLLPGFLVPRLVREVPGDVSKRGLNDLA